MKQDNRLDFLDGMRGLAILMVVVLHYIVQIYDVPQSIYYNKQTWLPNLDLGVQLFFVISGYVIFMTLDKTPNFLAFIARRWIRLFPAMLAATLIIAVAAHFIPYRPGGVPRLIDLLPGLSLLGANVVSTLSGVPTDGLERGFWSIYVEFRFYLLFGGCYYLFGKQRAFFVMAALSFAILALLVAADALGGANAARAHSLLGKMLIGHHLPWFLIGMHIYLYRFRAQRALLLLFVANAVAYNLETVGAVVTALLMALVTYAAFEVDIVQRFFRNRALLFFGFISYPLYLLNDSLGRGLIRGLYAALPPQVPFEALALVVLAPIACAAWCLAKYVEPAAQRWLKRRLLAGNDIRFVPAALKQSWSRVFRGNLP